MKPLSRDMYTLRKGVPLFGRYVYLSSDADMIQD